jgi:hypothetical protein
MNLSACGWKPVAGGPALEVSIENLVQINLIDGYVVLEHKER